VPALTTGISRSDLLSDARFTDDAKRAANSAALTEIVAEAFASQPLAHWREAFDQAHITYGAVRAPNEVIKEPQLLANDIIVPLQGGGEHLKFTVSSPLEARDVPKVSARRASDLGEHNEEVLRPLGFTGDEIDGLRAGGAIPHARHLEAAVTQHEMGNLR
jgi:crotonobetainyl-CoA:carnitine CoA-transferase CaiB-like acyl-CoA transferase